MRRSIQHVLYGRVQGQGSASVSTVREYELRIFCLIYLQGFGGLGTLTGYVPCRCQRVHAVGLCRVRRTPLFFILALTNVWTYRTNFNNLEILSAAPWPFPSTPIVTVW